jgi:hypothetical protein
MAMRGGWKACAIVLFLVPSSTADTIVLRLPDPAESPAPPLSQAVSDRWTATVHNPGALWHRPRIDPPVHLGGPVEGIDETLAADVSVWGSELRPASPAPVAVQPALEDAVAGGPAPGALPR